jgi:hypothetical protein
VSDAITPQPARPDRPPAVRLVRGQEVSLGCGTLVLIALIVMFFGGHGSVPTGVQNEVAGLRSEVAALKKAVEGQTAEIKALRQQLEKPKGKD